MYDLLPVDIAVWQQVERTCNDVLQSYGYHEIRLPLLEKSRLFSQAIGTTSDVVSKEMYSFEDRNGDQLSLRPEGTAGCVRAAIANGLLKSNCCKLRYSGPMFRRENVQRGRNRQFYQIGAEAYGLVGPDVDAELVLVMERIFKDLGISGIRLEINSLGTSEARSAYRQVLVDYLSQHQHQLDEDSVRRLKSNPLRILDSKNPAMRELIAQAPSMLDHLDDESLEHFQVFQQIIQAGGIEFTVNPRLVRGLDYYSRSVFEWITEDLGSQGTVCGGGRYDGLVARQGGPEMPAVGFSIGVDRMVELMKVQSIAVDHHSPHVFMVLAGERATASGLLLADQWRQAVPGLRIECNLGAGSFKAQFKRADRSGALVAIVLGDRELDTSVAAWKPLRDDQEQQQVDFEKMPEALAGLLKLS
jgi:histidyl-tRNA synthetase